MEPPNNQLTFERFVLEIPQHPSSIRHGQWAYMLLWENSRELATQIKDTDLDPYNWNDSLYLTSKPWQALMTYLASNWNGPIT